MILQEMTGTYTHLTGTVPEDKRTIYFNIYVDVNLGMKGKQIKI